MNINTTMKKILVMTAFGFCYSEGSAQVIFTQDFEGATDPGTLLPTLWTESGLSTDGMYFVGDETDANSAGFWVLPPHTLFALTNDDACNCNKSADRMVLPVQDFSSYTGGLTLSFARSFIANSGTVTASVVVSTDGGSTYTPVFAIPTGGAVDGGTGVATTTWGTYSVPLNAYIGMANVRIGFLYNDGGTWGYGLAIDDVSLTVTPPAPNVTVTAGIGFDYTIIPATEAVSPILVDLNVSNIGTANAANVTVSTNIYDATLTTLLTTLSGATTNLAGGASAIVSMGTYSPTQTVIFEHIVQTAGDASALNDTLYEAITIDLHEYARDNGSPVGGTPLGTNPGATLTYGVTFAITNEVTIDSALMFINPGTTSLGNNVKFFVAPTVAGVPTTSFIGQSANHTITPLDTNGIVLVLPITSIATGGALTLAPGVYFVGYNKVEAAGQNHAVQSSTSIITPNTAFASINGGAFATIQSFGFNVAPIIRAFVASTCANNDASVITTQSACGASTGSATATPNGPSPYTYTWSNGATTASNTGIPAGSYNLTVVDFFGCQFDSTGIIVSNPGAPTVTSGTLDAPNCNGDSDGSAAVVVSGGTPGFTYVWTPNVSTSATATNIAAGSYSVVVTDAASCSGTVVFTITEPTVISGTTTSTPTDCATSTDGIASVTATGGTPGYTYLWTPSNQTTSAATNVAGGSYSVLVTDANGCDATFTTTVTSPSAISSTGVTTEESVAGNGAINTTSTGGAGSYTYSWSNGATTEDITGLTAGTYTVVITDANGCTTNASYTVTSTIGINELNTLTVQLAPNPTTGNFTITAGTETIESIQITDFAGRNLVVKSTVLATGYSVDLSAFANGTYIVSVTTATGNATARIQVLK